MKFEVKPEE